MAKPKQDPIEAIIFYVFQYSNVVGVLNHSYDREKHQLVYSRKTFIYNIVLHSALVTYLPIFILSGIGFHTDDIFVTNPIAVILYAVVILLNLLCIGISLISQWTCREKLQRLFNALNGIWFNEMKNWDKSPQIQRETFRLVCVEIVATVVMTIQTLCVSFEYRQTSVLMAISAVYFTLLVNIAITAQFQFIMGMLYAGYMFKVLNYRLAEIVEEIQMNSISVRKARLLCKELTKIGRIRGRLVGLAVGIKDLYQYLVLLIMLTCFVAVVHLLFYLSVIFRGLTVNVVGYKVLHSIGAAFFCIADFWVQLYICGVVVDTCNETGAILRVLSEKESVDNELERSIEVLSLQLMREKMRLTICGLFDLDGQTGFAMIRAAMMNLILLLQIDYQNF